MSYKQALRLFVLSALSVRCIAQHGSEIPQKSTVQTAQATCVILKRMGPADQITSHFFSFGIRGKQFQYVEGKLPDGFPFHGRLTDHDVRDLQSRGAEAIVVESHYTADDLKQARAECRKATGEMAHQVEARSAHPHALMRDAASSNSFAHPSPSAAVASPAQVARFGVTLEVASEPQGADIEIDGSFVGSTPSTLQITAGDHTITLKKNRFKDWEHKVNISAGSNVHLNVELEKVLMQ